MAISAIFDFSFHFRFHHFQFKSYQRHERANFGANLSFSNEMAPCCVKIQDGVGSHLGFLLALPVSIPLIWDTIISLSFKFHQNLSIFVQVITILLFQIRPPTPSWISGIYFRFFAWHYLQICFYTPKYEVCKISCFYH